MDRRRIDKDSDKRISPPKASQVLLSPILKGGRAISESFPSVTALKAQTGNALMKGINGQFTNSAVVNNGATFSSGSSPNDSVLVSLHHLQVTAEQRHAELETSVERMVKELSMLRLRIDRHEQTMASMSQQVENVTHEQTSQRQCVERVQRRLHGHRVGIDRALQQAQIALQEQSQVLSGQQLLIERMERQNVSVGGVLIESVYILVGMYVLQTPLFKYTVRLVTVHLDASGRHRAWLPRFLQIFFFMHFLNVCKAFSRRLHFTSQLWSLIRRSGETAWQRLSALQPALLRRNAPSASSTQQCTNTFAAGRSGSPIRGVGLAGLLDDYPKLTPT